MSRLTPGAAHVVEQFEPAGHVDIDELGLAAARELEQQLMAEVPHEPSIADVSDHTMAGPECDIPLRVYRPDASPSSGTLSSGTPSSGTLSSGTIVFFHGGGWVMGNIELADTLCRGIARASEAAVVSVGYRLAPENPYPAALDDSFAATCWVVENARALRVDASRLAVCGSSAGGNLAASVALAARDRGGPELQAQVLMCPALDPRFDTASYVENGRGYPLSVNDMRFFWTSYLGDVADVARSSADPAGGPADPDETVYPADSLAAPLRSTDLGGLPPAGVVTAECDVLRDEGLAYAHRLERSGVSVETWDHTGMFHGFYGFVDELEDARRCVANVAGFLRDRLDPAAEPVADSAVDVGADATTRGNP